MENTKDQEEIQPIIRRQVTVYKCPFCPKKMFVHAPMVKHIKFCINNPAGLNRALCQNCKHCVKGSEEIDIGDNYFTGEPIIKPVTTYTCSVKDIGLYPPIALRKGLVDRYSWQFQNKELMPIRCQFFERSED